MVLNYCDRGKFNLYLLETLCIYEQDSLLVMNIHACLNTPLVLPQRATFSYGVR